MFFALVDDRGERLGSYDDEEDARAAFREIVASDPTVAEELLLIPYGDDGRPGDALMYEDLIKMEQAFTIYFSHSESMTVQMIDGGLVLDRLTETIRPKNPMEPQRADRFGAAWTRRRVPA